MSWYKRLFWKIFAAIWLVSLLALLATITWIGNVTEKDKFEQIMMARANAYAEVMVERYERQGRETLLPFRPPPRRFYDLEDDDDDEPHEHRREWRKRDHHRMPRITDRVQITDLQSGRKVVGPGQFNPDPKSLQTFTITSENGSPYRVELDLNWQQSPLGEMLRALVSIQLIWIILVSGLGALLISAMIVRPLNRLRAHTQAIYLGELDRRTDQSLNKRGDELGELAREFDRMAEYVERTLNSHQKLMQDVSHELRAPLARLQAAAGLAEQRLGEVDPAVARINLECQRLDQLIGELLTLSRLEQMGHSGDVVDLTDLIEASVQDQQFAHPQRTFQTRLQPHCTSKISHKLLQRAFDNILGNACKHTPEDSPVAICLDCTENGFTLTIRDHGPGVPEAELEHLFDPFYRATGHTDGYGLGLSIAQRAIQHMGGSLTLHNHPDGGLEAIIQHPGQS